MPPAAAGADSTADTIVVLAMLVNAVFLAGLFSWLSVTGWARQRRGERESALRYDFYRQLLERGEMTSERFEQARREDAVAARARGRDGLRLGAIILLGIGAGALLAFFKATEPAIRGLGWIPLLAGAALLLHVFIVARRPN